MIWHYDTAVKIESGRVDPKLHMNKDWVQGDAHYAIVLTGAQSPAAWVDQSGSDIKGIMQDDRAVRVYTVC